MFPKYITFIQTLSLTYTLLLFVSNSLENCTHHRQLDAVLVAQIFRFQVSNPPESCQVKRFLYATSLVIPDKVQSPGSQTIRILTHLVRFS